MKKILLLLCALLGSVGAMADVITDASQLSNSKAYTVVTERGAWWADLTNNRMHYAGAITDPANVPNDANYKFAIIKQGESFFLYSIGAGKFVNPQKYFTTITPTPITINSLVGGKFKMTSTNPNKAINIGGDQWTWDGWTSTDGGNTLTISEVEDFDPAEALALLATKVYTVSCGRGTWAATTTTLTGNGNENVPSGEEYKQFALFTNGGKMYLYSVGAEKFVKSDGSLFDGKGDPITFNTTSDADYPYHFYFPLAEQIYFNMQDGAKSIVFNSWGGQDAGSKYQIEEVTSANVDAITAKATEVFYGSQTITYTIKINGNIVATEIREQKVGETASLSSTYTGKEFVTYSYSPETIGIGTTDVVVTATVGALPFEVSTDFENAKWYNLRINQTQRYVGKEDNEPYHTYAESDITEITRASTAYQWAFMGNPVSGIKVINKETGADYSLTVDGEGNNVNGAEGIPNTVLRSGNHYWDIHQNGDGFSLNLIGKSNYYINTHGGTTGHFQIWQSGGAKTDQGSRLIIAEVPDLETTVTYNVSFNDKVVHTVEAYGVIGTTLGTLPGNINRDFVTITGFDGETEITRDMTVNLTASWNGPFELSDSYENAHWYNMAVRGDYYVTSGNKAGDNALAPVPANAIGLVEDAYQWAFVGDPYHIKLYNKAEGDSKAYAWTSNDNSSIPVFVDAASAHVWFIKASTSGIDNTFMLTTDLGYQTNQFGGSTGSLKIWEDTRLNDPGSAFKAFNVPSNFAEFVAAEISPYFDSTAKYFVLTDAVKAEIGYNESYKTDCPYTTYKSMKEKLEAVDMTDLNNFVLPETGYYRFKNVNYNTYMGLKATTVYGNYNSEADINGPVTVVKLTKGTGDNVGKYSIQLQGKYLQGLAQSANVPLNDDAAWFTPTIPTPGTGTFSTTPESSHTFIHCAGGGEIVGWTKDAAASKWTLEDATTIKVSISDAGYATLCVPFPVTIPSGVKAYTVSGISGGLLTLAEISTTIPSGTAVILEGDENTYTFDIAGEVSPIASNELTGTFLEMAAPNNSYILQNHSGDVGFYKVDTSEATPKVPANRAYLPASVSGNVKAFFFDQADAIKSVFSGIAEGKIFDLSGRKVAKMQKGNTYIVNGKKVNVK